MGQEMEDVCENFCAFYDSLQIDFDYEFDAATYFDFTRPETPEEVEESERWFQLAEGYPPSPLVVKLHWGTDEFRHGQTSPNKYGHKNTHSIDNDSDLGGASETSSPDREKKGYQKLKSNSKSQSHPFLSRTSRLLQPTASHLAKQIQQISVRSTRILGRLLKLGSPIKSPGELVAIKRQKLEIGYLRKVAYLKQQTSFSHKIPQKVGTTDVNYSHTRPRVTIPKEPNLETAHRAQRQRSKNAAQPGSNPKSNNHSLRTSPLNGKILGTPSLIQPKKKTTPSAEFQKSSCFIQAGNIHRASSAIQSGMLDHLRKNSNNACLQDKSNAVDQFKGYPFNKKIFSSRGDLGVFQKSKRETTVLRNPPIDLLKELSVNSENQLSSLPEEKKLLQMKGIKKNAPCSIMKENKELRNSLKSSPFNLLRKSNLTEIVYTKVAPI